MCRIAGIINFSDNQSGAEHVLSNMCDLQKHGGPDDSGIVFSKDYRVLLGNRRLSLLDMTQAGHMPMQYQDRYYITYNGEIYNYKSLKEELVHLGHQFKNQTDTEVIMAAYAQWGVLSFSKLRGMFAFALWDTFQNEVLLVRDSVGIKQLYYGMSNTNFVFASELRAFQAVPGFQVQNENWPVYMMAFGHLPEPITTLKNVKPLPKGCFIKYNVLKQTSTLQSFLHYTFSHQIIDEQAAKEQVRYLLEKSVARNLIADAPIGVFLSGGLDSSIITSISSKLHSQHLKTLSIYFKETEYSEKGYQDKIIERVQCDHQQFLLSENDFHESFTQIIDSMDMPSCDGINTWFICKQAAALHYKAVLSGLGGDEVFGGYPSFNRISKAIQLQKMPALFKSIANESSNKILSRMSYLNISGIRGVYLFLRGHFTPNVIARQLGSDENSIWKILEDDPQSIYVEDIHDKNKASWMEFNLYMQNQLLRDADIMSMIHGIELRVPFLDEDLITFANKVHPKIKYIGTRPKQFLIDIYKNELPQEIWNRKKMGFSFPFQKWFLNSEYIKDMASDGGENFKRKYEQFKVGKLHWSQLLSLVILKNRNIVA